MVDSVLATAEEETKQSDPSSGKRLLLSFEEILDEMFETSLSEVDNLTSFENRTPDIAAPKQFLNDLFHITSSQRSDRPKKKRRLDPEPKKHTKMLNPIAIDAQIKLHHCCGKNCLQQFSVEQILTERLIVAEQSEIEHTQYIISAMRSSWNSHKFDFRIQGKIFFY